MKYENDFYVSAVKIGKQAPRFSMEALNPLAKSKHEVMTVDLDDYLDQGKWIVLYFYGQNFTDDALKTIASYNDKFEDFNQNEAIIIAVSTDSIMAHIAWQEGVLGKLNHAHASDLNHKVSEAFGVLDELKGKAYPGFFIIEPSGILKAMQVTEGSAKMDASSVYTLLMKLKDDALR